jgi:hypothetical protein
LTVDSQGKVGEVTPAGSMMPSGEIRVATKVNITRNRIKYDSHSISGVFLLAVLFVRGKFDVKTGGFL